MEKPILERLKLFIREKGITNRKVASLLGINEMTLNNKLNGIRNLDLNTIELFAEHFDDLSMEWLIRGTQGINNSATANGDGSVAVSGNNNSHVVAGGETALLKERINHLEEMLAEKERLIKVYEKIMEERK